MKMMETINLSFTEDEMTQFLVGKGYVVEKIRSWDNYTEYHNHVVTEDVDVIIAYPDLKRPTDEELERDATSLKTRYGLRKQFTKEFYEALLNL